MCWQEWAGLVARGEVPNRMSSRDGKLLKLVPASERLSQAELAAHLMCALQSYLQAESRAMLCNVCLRGEALLASRCNDPTNRSYQKLL